jgi:hypothetical protein
MNRNAIRRNRDHRLAGGIVFRWAVGHRWFSNFDHVPASPFAGLRSRTPLSTALSGGGYRKDREIPWMRVDLTIQFKR